MWKKRPLPERLTLWSEIRFSQTSQDGTIQPVWLHRLDVTNRMETAREQSQLPRVELDYRWQTELFSMFGWDEALRRLQPHLSSPEVEVRAFSSQALAGIARHQPERHLEVLAILQGKRNEPDPVRSAFLQGLADLPPSRWKTEHLEPLADLLDALLKAADASAVSFRYAEALLLRLLPSHPEFSATWLAKTLRHWGTPSGLSWQNELSGEEAQEQVDSALSPLLSDWFRSERYGEAFALVESLGDKLEKLPQLLELVVSLCDLSLPFPSGNALWILSCNAPERARQLVPELLEQDPSWVSKPWVQNFLHRHRQDLLTPFLGTNVVHGKFATGQTRWVLSFSGSFWRWTPEQQALYAEQLARLIRDQSRDFRAQRQSLRSLAGLTDLETPETLARTASLREDRQALRDEALRCLARVEDGRGLPFLVEALDDERARVAIYALRGAVLAMPAQSALEFLLQVKSSKVTVNKEVARLLGDLPQAVGLPSLLQRVESETHRDVRLAIMRGLWPHLDRDEVWPPFWEALGSDDPAVGMALAAIATESLGRVGRERVVCLLAKLLKHPSARVRQTVLSRLSAQPISGVAVEDLLKGSRDLLSHRQMGFAAASALVAQMLATPDQWETLLAQVSADRLALKTLVQCVRHGVYRYHRQPGFAQVKLATRRHLASDQELLPLYLEFLAATAPFEELLEEVERLVSDESAALEILAGWSQVLSTHTYCLGHPTYSLLRDRWSDRSQPVLRRLRLETLLVHVKGFGWTPENRADLEQYKEDPSWLVRCKAAFVLTPPVK